MTVNYSSLLKAGAQVASPKLELWAPVSHLSASPRPHAGSAASALPASEARSSSDEERFRSLPPEPVRDGEPRVGPPAPKSRRATISSATAMLLSPPLRPLKVTGGREHLPYGVMYRHCNHQNNLIPSLLILDVLWNPHSVKRQCHLDLSCWRNHVKFCFVFSNSRSKNLE